MACLGLTKWGDGLSRLQSSASRDVVCHPCLPQDLPSPDAADEPQEPIKIVPSTPQTPSTPPTPQSPAPATKKRNFDFNQEPGAGHRRITLSLTADTADNRWQEMKNQLATSIFSLFRKWHPSQEASMRHASNELLLDPWPGA